MRPFLGNFYPTGHFIYIPVLGLNGPWTKRTRQNANVREAAMQVTTTYHVHDTISVKRFSLFHCPRKHLALKSRRSLCIFNRDTKTLLGWGDTHIYRRENIKELKATNGFTGSQLVSYLHAHIYLHAISFAHMSKWYHKFYFFFSSILDHFSIFINPFFSISIKMYNFSYAD